MELMEPVFEISNLAAPEIPAQPPMEDAFEAKVWNEPLAKFAAALGISISLFDQYARRRAMVSAGPIGERLDQADFFSAEGVGTLIDEQAARQSLKNGKTAYSVQLEMFAHLAIPLHVDGVVRAVFVAGWIPERFADPVSCDLVAKRINANSMEIWQLMRMQQPISREKLETHGRMLETFSAPLVRQLLLQNGRSTARQAIQDRGRNNNRFCPGQNRKSVVRCHVGLLKKIGPRRGGGD